MPEKKGRRRRSGGRHHEGSSPESHPAPAATPGAPQRIASPRRADPLVPSNTARATGLMIAVITAFLAVLMISDAATGGGGIDATVRIAAGVSLVLLAAVVGALSVFPAQIRRRIRGE